MNKNYWVKIQKNTPTVSSRGDRADSWATIATVWADIRHLRGREFYTAQQVNSEITVKILIWHRSDVTSKMRVVSDIGTFDLVSPPINVGMKNIELELMCKEVNG